MKRKIVYLVCISLIVCLSVLVPIFAQPSDIIEHWAEKEISEWIDKGYVSGYEDGTFRPDRNITRAEFITMVNRLFGYEETVEIEYSDVSENDWFVSEVRKAAAAGYIHGYRNGKFRPYSKISRQEAAAMVAKIANLDTSGNLDEVNKLKDKWKIMRKYKGSVNAVLLKQYMKPYDNNLFKPLKFMTRAEVIVMLNNIYLDINRRPIKTISATNGTINVTFDESLDGLSTDDFSITAALNDNTYELKDLVFNSNENSFTFMPIAKTYFAQTLKINVAASAISMKVKGSAAATVDIPTIPAGIASGGGGYYVPPVTPPVERNTAPSTPVITVTPSTERITVDDLVTITALSTDTENDTISYTWTGRLGETSKYPAGKQIITVKAVDEHGLESQPAVVVFFVLDITNGGGGVMLTDPESRIYENGIEGATITKYTFNVPSVMGHSGSDYAWVKGLNKNTCKWEDIQYAATNNGISFTNSLTPGVYTKLEFFYYASHCMYGKSNITYTVEFSFDGTNPVEEIAPTAKNVSIVQKQGKTLEGIYIYEDANGDLEGVSTYKWYRSDDANGTNKAAISGATEKTYTLTTEDAGKFITFEVTPIAKTGVDGTITGTAVQSSYFEIKEYAPIAIDIKITGKVKVGETLTGDYTYIDINGDLEGTSTYKWYRADDASGANKTAISGITEKTYTLAAEDSGKYISFEVTPIAATGTLAGIPLESMPILIDEVPPTATDVEITGHPILGYYLTGNYTFVDINGDLEGQSTYKWYRADTIEGSQTEIANTDEYELTAADTNKYIFFEVTPVAQSVSGNAVKSKPVFIAKEAPYVEDISVTGTQKVGEKLTANYTFVDLNGDPEVGAIYKWFREDDSEEGYSLIEGATSNEYTLTADNEGQYLLCQIIAVSKSGQNATTGGWPSYEYIGPIMPGETAPTASDVTITGTPEVGEKLTGDYSYQDVNGDPEGTSVYKWYRADDANGTNKAVINNANTIEYTLTTDDADKYISFEVTPVATTGILTGSPVESAVFGPITVPDTTKPIITLIGDSEVTVEVSDIYNDAGAIASDDYDGNITDEIVVVNNVNASLVGTYTVTYDVSDTAGNSAVQVIRTVNVVDNTKPVITLLGNSEIIIFVGDSYIEAGATAVDNFDGDITTDIIITGTVDTTTPGTYEIKYNVKDSSNNIADEVTRIVEVEVLPT